MLRRSAAFPRQNGLAVALREIGRLERTLFTLDWIRDLDLRRRTQAGLNKGEARNALARALFFNRLGELRDRRFENQAFRASGLNLLVAAIILCNSRYLAAAFDSLYRADPARESGPDQGTRSGPAIVRSIVELYGGEAKTESTESTGTTVRLFFPAAG